MRVLGFSWLASLFLGGCATAPPSSASGPDVGDYVPLEVGHTWTYAVRFPGQTGERTVRIVSQDDEGFFVDDAGGAFRLTPAGLRDRQRYLIRTPIEAGRTWSAVISASAVEHYTLVSSGAPCECRAGRFADCLVVEAKIRRDPQVTLRSRFVWARRVGLVEVSTAVLHATRGELPQTEQSLLRYSLGTGTPAAMPAVEGAPDEEDEGAPTTWGR
ncbi:MAG: hypothetical protein AAFZ18_09440 [Myxococcota bacterium]